MIRAVLQDYAGHKDPRTTRRYDHSRDSLDRNAAYTVAAYLALWRTLAPSPAGHQLILQPWQLRTRECRSRPVPWCFWSGT